MEYTYKDSYDNSSLSKYFSRIFGYMVLGLLVTFLVGFTLSVTDIFLAIFLSPIGYGFLFISSIVEIILVIAIHRSIYKVKATNALLWFLIFSVLNGVTFGYIFFAFELSDVVLIFLLTSGVFGVMALLGATTKLDLSKLSVFLFTSLILLLIASIISFFFYSSVIETIITIVGLALFLLITAYDMHMIKRRYNGELSIERQNNLAIYGALELYLDFINIFIRLVELFGRYKD